jgi:hypothetical protein
MTYRLKTIRFRNRDVKILLQNENGPCPLLAAANVLLLEGSIVLPPHAIRNDVASLEDLTNLLANHAITGCHHHHHQEKTDATTTSSSEETDRFFVHELVSYIPKFQYGMDINVTFTKCQGYEYTAELTAFDMLGCKLVHGWLIAYDDPAAAAIGTKSYNELVEIVIAAKDDDDAPQQEEISKYQQQEIQMIDGLEKNDVSPRMKLQELERKLHDRQERVLAAHWIEQFLNETSHQLTMYGLEQLHSTVKEDELCVFFRNNHYATITKHQEQLYMLVTDLGYANTPDIVWEKMDDIIGDTELCNSQFAPVRGTDIRQSGPTLTPEQMMAASSQKDADYHLALHWSQQTTTANNTNTLSANLDEQEGQIMAAATEASLREYNGLPSNIALSGTTTSVELPPGIPPGMRMEVGIPVSGPSAKSLSPEKIIPSHGPSSTWNHHHSHSQEEADRMLAMQLSEHPSELNGGMDEEASLKLARMLQEEENQRATMRINNNAVTQSQQYQQQQQRRGRPDPPASSSSSSEKCNVM